MLGCRRGFVGNRKRVLRIALQLVAGQRLIRDLTMVTGKVIPMGPFYRCLAVCLLILSGCKAQYFHAETTLAPDGSIDRAILQPKGSTPKAALEPAVWDKTGWTSEKSFEDFEGGIRDLNLSEAGSDYFAAWTSVGSAEDLPGHYVRSAIDDRFNSQFKRKFERRDLGLLTEFIWRETLTDIVTLEDFRKAREEGIDLLCEIVEPTLARTLGEDHDTSKLMAWFRNEGTVFVMDATDLLYEFGRAGAESIADDSRSAVFQKRFFEICERHGFAEIFNDEDSLEEKLVRRVATRIIRENVVRRDGEALNKDVIHGLLGAAGLSNAHEKLPLAKAFVKEWKRVIKERDGGKEAFDSQTRNIVSRIQGVHGGFLPVSTDQFRFVMTFPGTVVQTNGELLADDRVRWQFRGADAWPSGFTMIGRSLLDESGSVGELSNWRSGLNRAAMTRLHDLATRDERLVEALKKCRIAGQLTALRKLAETSDDENLVALSRNVLRLLTAPDDVP